MEDDSIPVQHSQDTIVYSEQQHTDYDENADFSDDDCVFCMIVNGMNEGTEILKKVGLLPAWLSWRNTQGFTG